LEEYLREYDESAQRSESPFPDSPEGEDATFAARPNLRTPGMMPKPRDVDAAPEVKKLYGDNPEVVFFGPIIFQ